jgi:hypothetical protein
MSTKMNIKLQNLLINFISCSNTSGWNNEFNTKAIWKFSDGTTVISEVNEFMNAEDWLEVYDQLSDKLVVDYRGISFTEQQIVKEIQEEGNLLEFVYDMNFIDGSNLVYRYVQFGEGNEAARMINDNNLSKLFFNNWIKTSLSLNDPKKVIA